MALAPSDVDPCRAILTPWLLGGLASAGHHPSARCRIAVAELEGLGEGRLYFEQHHCTSAAGRRRAATLRPDFRYSVIRLTS